MKKIFNGFLVVALVMMLFTITGCGKDLSAYAGVYKGEYSKFVGDTMDAASKEEFSLELNRDGSGKHNRDGESFNVTWSVSGEEFKMTETFLGMSNEYTGTLKDGKLDIFNGDPTNDLTYEYVYNKK